MRKHLSVLMGIFLTMLVFGLLMPAARAAQATPTTWYVATWGNDSNDCRSWKTACRTIGEARYRSSAGDIIRIGPGTFEETLNLFASTTLLGSGINRTIVDGKGAGSVFTIYSSATVHMSHMTIRNGLATDADRGGAITNWGAVTLDHVIIRDNRGVGSSAVGGIASSGPITITNSAIINNSGTGGYGGLIVQDRLYMENVTIAGNKAPEHSRGGALTLYGIAQATLVNVTISGNESFFSSGGIVNMGDLTLVNVTLANHSVVSSAFREVDIYNSGRVTFRNTIVAGGCAGDGTFTSQGHNLESKNTCGFTHSTDKPNTDPQLAPLADNGGLGKTHALTPGSPAIDAGDNATCPKTDQRGIGRWDGDGDGKKVCDVGAYEYMPAGALGKRTYVPLVY